MTNQLVKTKRAITIALTLLALAATGCSGTTAATDAATTGNDAGQTSAPDTGSTNDAGVVTDAGPMIDVGVDAGCMSTMPHCNTCTTPATDPFNACTSAVTNCIAFDNTRVPGWPDHIPPVGP